MVASLLLLTSSPLVAAPPNFILIFCDDLGYGDIGCFGSEKHRTPNIDRLAAEGMKLTSFYSTCGVCTPSRSSLMTACYPRRVNMHESARKEWVLFPLARKGLNPKETTIAEVLKTKGYATACIGKWHLGDQKPFLPTEQGFDKYFGIPYSNDMGSQQRKQNPPLPLLAGKTVIEAPVDQNTITQRYTEQAVNFITENKDRPFFIYLPHTMPHNPVHASDRFRGKSANGGYGDSVEEIDWSTGEILKTLQKLNLDEQTLILFTSDNGAASRWGGSNKPLSGFKGSTMEGGMRVPCVVRWPGRIPAGSSFDQTVSTIDLLPTFAEFADAKAPPKSHIDGISIADILTGQSKATPHDAYYYYFRDALQAVRSGPWKLHLARTVKPRNKPARVVPAKLYNLEDDIAESNNVIDDHPDVVKKLEELADVAREKYGDQKKTGSLQRPAGLVDEAVPLVLNE
ncbi:MAG: sulfatase [Planctomycetaceae bacterium]|nr:sulfatase [Planctomycetaceae bacterium]